MKKMEGLCKMMKLSRFYMWTCRMIFICCALKGRKINEVTPLYLTFPQKRKLAASCIGLFGWQFELIE